MCPCIRPEAETVIQELKTRGLALYIISGDHEESTKALARQLGINHYFSETLPEDNLRPNNEGDRALIDIPKGTELTVDYFPEDHRTTTEDIS